MLDGLNRNGVCSDVWKVKYRSCVTSHNLWQTISMNCAATLYGMGEVKRQKVVDASQRKELLSEPTIIKHNAPVPKLYSHHSSSSIVIIFWQVGLVQFQVFWWWVAKEHIEKRQQIDAAFATGEIVYSIFLFKAASQAQDQFCLWQYRCSEPWPPLSVQPGECHWRYLSPTWPIKSEKVFKNTYLEFPSWSSHLAGVDQPTLSVSEHFRRWAILKIPFPLPHRQRLQNVWRWTLCN